MFPEMRSSVVLVTFENESKKGKGLIKPSETVTLIHICVFGMSMKGTQRARENLVFSSGLCCVVCCLRSE